MTTAALQFGAAVRVLAGACNKTAPTLALRHRRRGFWSIEDREEKQYKMKAEMRCAISACMRLLHRIRFGEDKNEKCAFDD